MEELQRSFYEKYARTQTNTVRKYLHKIDWSNRIIGIKGSRGVGKTTLILQYIKMNFKANNQVLYASLDNMYFASNTLYNLADTFHKRGGILLALDEVHRYPNWAVELKNIYDDMPGLKLIFTGSSLLHLHQAKADLSRRAVMFNMPGLSFREFLEFETKQSFEVFSFENILHKHIDLAIDIVKKIKPLAHFDNYLNFGYFPFYLENKKAFHQKLSEVILTVLEIDIVQFASIPPQNIIFLKRLLTIISNSVPFKPNIKSLSQKTGISVNTLKAYLKLLNDAEMINLLYMENKGVNSLNKPEKIYINNSNLMVNLDASNANPGNIRETFFMNQVAQVKRLIGSPIADFLVDGNTFEVGGKSKNRKQVWESEKAFVVKDDIEIGAGNSIPLWLFGFLY
jgi:hypothetical protein